MAFEGLITELKRFTRERVPGMKARQSIEALGGPIYDLELEFLSSSRTFGSIMTKEYEDGQTVVCMLKDHDLEVAVMLFSSANDWVRGMEKGKAFDLRARLVSYDTLYERAIFGHAQEETEEAVSAEAPPAAAEPEPVQPIEQHREVIRRAVRGDATTKRPRRLRNKKVSQRKTFRKSAHAMAPGAIKVWGRPRKLKVSKRPSARKKSTGHPMPARKPLKKTRKAAVPKFRVTAGPSAQPPSFPRNATGSQPPPDPALVLRILRKGTEKGKGVLSSPELQILDQAGFGSAVSFPPKNESGSPRIFIGIFLILALVLVLLVDSGFPPGVLIFFFGVGIFGCFFPEIRGFVTDD